MKFWYSPNFLAIFFLIFLSIPALKALATPGFYTSHDGETHTARIAQYYQALSDGQIPPRFAKTFYNDYASPIFVYIYPLPYFLGSVLHFLGFSFIDSFKVLMALAYIASAIFACLWISEVLKSAKSGFLGALFYVWVPYRFSLIYVRASISEMLAYTFLPLVLYSLTKLIRTTSMKWFVLTAISSGLLLLSQNLVAFISLAPIIFYGCLLSILNKTPRRILLTCLSLLWGFLISSITYLPSLFERNFIHFNELIKTQFVHHFVTIYQLIYSPWGYGFDLVGTINDQMSFQIGLAHILIILISLIMIGFGFLQKLRIRLIPSPFFENIENQDLLLFGLFFILILASIFMMVQTKLSLSIWESLRLFQIIDIPWRLLGLVVLSTAFIAGLVAKAIKSGFILITLVIAVLIANRNHLRINQSVNFDDNYFLNYKGHATQYSEFTPTWRQTVSIPTSSELIENVTGEMKIFNLFSKSNEISFDAEVETASRVKVNRFYFPKTSVKIDDQTAIFKVIDTEDTALSQKEDNTGLPLITLDRGLHEVLVSFDETPLRLFANYLSLSSFILALGITLKNAKK